MFEAFLFLQVLRTYYGGRDITAEDLKAALVVGMGPREHRRLMKKRFLRQQRSSNPSSTNEDLSITDANTVVSSGQRSSGQCSSRTIDGDIVSDPKTCVPGQENNDTPPPPSEVDQAENNSVSYENQNADVSGSDEDTKSSTVAVEPTARRHSRRSINKESLLGHGPHGKQVVDMIIEKEGDEGIRQFCQLWRTVFVDALQPAFLPPGWDVTHRSACLHPTDVFNDCPYM